MKLVVLGSGTSVPHAQRASAGFWLETLSGTLVLDFSADTSHRLAEEELDWANLDAIWLSHFHLDHLGGLAPFLFGTKHGPSTQKRTKPLFVYGPEGFKSILAAVDNSYNYGLMKQPFPLELIEVKAARSFELLPGLTANTFSTPHTPESMAIRLKDKSGSDLVYTSDTGYSEELAEFALNVTVLLMECSFHKNKPVELHLELGEAMQLAHKCQPQKLVLTHLYPEWDGIDLAAEARQLWTGETIEAVDGLRLEF
jgi:ribonuclease BN (tRNA processing enzyme)